MSKNVSKSAEDIDDTQKRFLDRLVQRWNFRIDLHVLCLILSGLILIIFSLIGFTWGMPARWEPDSITKEVIYLYDAHTLEPQSYKYGTFYLYTMLFLSKPFVSDPGAVTAFFYVPRILNILLGLGILIMVMQIGNRYRPIVGSLSTLLLSMTMGFINYIHFEVLDIPMLFFLVLCFLLLLRQKIWWAAVAFGFAVATKQIAILILPSIAAFIFVEHLSNKPWKTMLQRTAIFGSAGVVLFFVTSPYYLLNLSKVWALREYTKTTWFLSYRGLEGNIGWITHPYNLWNMLGPALFFTAILGIWLAWRERSILDREVLALLLPYLVLQLFFRMTPMRYLLPLAPLLIILAARFIVYGHAHWKPAMSKMVIVVVLICSLLWTSVAVYAIKFDSRYVAEQWIDRNIPQSMGIDIWSGLYLPRQLCAKCYFNFPGDQSRKITRPLPYLHEAKMREVFYLKDQRYQGYLWHRLIDEYFYENTDITKLGYPYIIITSLEYCRYFDDLFCLGVSDAEGDPKATFLYSRLLEEVFPYRIAAKFDTVPQRLFLPNPEFVDPTVLIFQRLQGDEYHDFITKQFNQLRVPIKGFPGQKNQSANYSVETSDAPRESPLQNNSEEKT